MWAKVPKAENGQNDDSVEESMTKVKKLKTTMA